MASASEGARLTADHIFLCQGSRQTCVNPAYGYLRAFDAFIKREHKNDYAEAWNSTAEIIGRKPDNWNTERDILAMWRDGRMTWDSNERTLIGNFTQQELQTIRARKRDLYQAVLDRFLRFGPTSLPKRFGTHNGARSVTVVDWWEDWELRDMPVARPRPPFEYVEFA